MCSYAYIYIDTHFIYMYVRVYVCMYVCIYLYSVARKNVSSLYLLKMYLLNMQFKELES